MKHLLFTFATIISLLASCTSKESEYNEAAKQLGEKHAQEIIEQELSDKELMIKILDVKARATEISQKVSHQAAHHYSSSFETYMRQHSDSLSQLIFTPSAE